MTYKRTDLALEMVQMHKEKTAGKGEINGIKKAFDPAECGGAPILGIRKPVIKSHGSSDAKTFKNAIKQAVAYSNASIEPLIEEAIASLKEGDEE